MFPFIDAHLNQRTERYVVISLLEVIEIVFMAFWNSLYKLFVNYASTEGNTYKSGLGLQLVNAIFFFVGILGLIPLSHFQFAHKKWVIIGDVCFMGLGLFLGLIGMGMCASFWTYATDVSNLDIINYHVAFWFIQVMVFIVALMYSYIYHNNNAGEVRVVNANPNQNTQQPLQQLYQPQQNPPFQQQHQQIIYQPIQQGQPLNSLQN